jgi:hypothetical protein
LNTRRGGGAAWLLIVRWLAFGALVALLIIGVAVGVPVTAWLLPILSAAFVGLFLSGRVPGNALGWIWLALGVVGMTNGVTAELAQRRLDSGIADNAAAWLAWLGWTLWIPTLTLTLLPLLLFPYGLWTPAWRWVLGALLTGTTVLTLLNALQPRFIDAERGFSVDNPAVPDHWTWLPSPEDSLVAGVALGVMGVSALAAAFGVVLRTVRSVGTERRQLQWFAFAAGIVGVAAAMAIVLSSDLQLWGLQIGDSVLPAAVAFLPVACAIAITRHGLYDIGRLISRSISYAVVTVVVGAVYGLVVTSIPQVLPVSSTLAVAGATLAAAGTVRPVLRRVQSAVDRRFNREGYDAARTAELFAQRLRDEVDPTAATVALVDTIGATLQPRAVAVWIRGTP